MSGLSGEIKPKTYIKAASLTNLARITERSVEVATASTG